MKVTTRFVIKKARLATGDWLYYFGNLDMGGTFMSDPACAYDFVEYTDAQKFLEEHAGKLSPGVYQIDKIFRV